MSNAGQWSHSPPDALSDWLTYGRTYGCGTRWWRGRGDRIKQWIDWQLPWLYKSTRQTFVSRSLKAVSVLLCIIKLLPLFYKLVSFMTDCRHLTWLGPEMLKSRSTFSKLINFPSRLGVSNKRNANSGIKSIKLIDCLNNKTISVAVHFYLRSNKILLILQLFI